MLLCALPNVFNPYHKDILNILYISENIINHTHTPWSAKYNVHLMFNTPMNKYTYCIYIYMYIVDWFLMIPMDYDNHYYCHQYVSSITSSVCLWWIKCISMFPHNTITYDRLIYVIMVMTRRILWITHKKQNLLARVVIIYLRVLR